MPVLKNPKWEMFAQECAKGISATESYVMSGFRYNDSNASKLFNHPDIQTRIQEIKIRASYRTEITVKSILEELAKIGFSNILDYVSTDEKGGTVYDLSKIERDKAAAIVELNIEESAPLLGRPPIKKTKIKLADKRAALVDLGKHFGAFKEQVDVNMKSNIESKTAGQVKQELLENLMNWGYVARPSDSGSSEARTGVVIPEANAEGSDTVQ